jgi:putative phage-type endonuclease
MPRILIEQGSAEWLALRRTKITASDAGVITQLNPWKTPRDLFFEKYGFTQVIENEAMRRGTAMEPFAREHFIKQTGIFVEPCVYISDHYDWMMSSFDGLSPDGHFAVEIKCGKKIFEQAKKGNIPGYYMAQIQHHFITANPLKYFFYAVDGKEVEDGGFLIKDFVMMEIEPDEDFIAEMVEKESRFYYNHLLMAEAPKIPQTVEEIFF